MRPLQGPVDYHRYPPRKRRTRPATSRRPENQSPAGEPLSTAHSNGELHQQESARREAHPREPRPREARFEHEVAHRHTPPESVKSKKANSAAKKAPSKPLWRRLRKLCFFLCLLLLAEGVFATLTSPKFAVQNVQVKGIHYTDASRVLSTQQSLVGQNWLRVRLKDAKQQLEAIPTVKEARVSRTFSWPPGAAIRIQERQGLVRVGAAKNWWIADANGFIFRIAEKEDDGIYAVTHPLVQPKIGHALPKEQWEPIFQLVAALEKSGFDQKLRRIYFDKQGFASLRLSGGSHNETLIQLGNERWPEKMERARQTLAFLEAKGRRASTINLVSYLRPTWTPRVEAKQNPDGPTSDVGETGEVIAPSEDAESLNEQ